MITSLVFFFSVFANAESLFYYARDPRSGRKVLTLEEIQALFARNREQIAPDTIASQQTSHEAKEHVVEAKDSQGEEVVQDVKCEKDSAVMVTTSEETPRAPNENVSVQQTTNLADEIPASQDQQDKSPLSMERAPPPHNNTKASTKIKLPPLRVQHHLNIKEENAVKNLSEQFEANTPLQKIPIDAAEKDLTTEGNVPQSTDELVLVKTDTSTEGTDANGMTSGGTPDGAHCDDRVCINNIQANPLIPSATPEAGEWMQYKT